MLLSQPLSRVTPTEPFFQFLPTKFTACEIPKMNSRKKTRIVFNGKPCDSSWSNSWPSCQFIHKSLPLATAAALLLLANPAKAGFLSGFSGIESIPGPQLPQMDFLTRFNGLVSCNQCQKLVLEFMLVLDFDYFKRHSFAEENQKKYAEADARFKSSPILKELLERSKLNKEK
uniref:Uncharacterized protein LOC105116656 isoform X2 n=1 Tax=Rhizophora mucronata TaxID=61149 RepID=A0A2P2J6Z8_RHIMU